MTTWTCKAVGSLSMGLLVWWAPQAQAEGEEGATNAPPVAVVAATTNGVDRAHLETAAKAYGCSVEEAAAMLEQVRPERRAAFLAGKLPRTNGTAPAATPRNR